VVPVRLHSGIREPRKIVDVPPVYPQLAQASRVEGLVIIEATIDVRGAVQSARVLRSLPFLDEAALDAVRQWKYTPALLNGVPVPVIMTVTVNFTLQ
jgi:periplasmic protein TonB